MAETDTYSNDDSDFILEPLVYKPSAGSKPGKFTALKWDRAPKPNGGPVKDLILVTDLEEKNELGLPVQVEHRFNMLPRGRGLSEYKKQMARFLERPLTPLAGISHMV